MEVTKNITKDSKIDLAVVSKIIRKHKDNTGGIIEIFQDIQAYFNYLPKEALQFVSKKRGIPISRIYHVATFYPVFSFTPRGRYIISVCAGTACHVRGAPLLLGTIQRELNISIGETTRDKIFTLEVVRCIGACSIAPVIRINDKTFGSLNPARLLRLLNEYRKELKYE